MGSTSSNSGSGCFDPMTRSQLLALRNSNGLEVNCHYTISDYNRANVGTAEIILHAISENVLSMSVHVNTTFDNSGWVGKYDIDTNRITSLEDNRGNKVHGQSGAEVDRFPWGNVFWRETTIDNANVFVEQGTSFRSYNNEFKTDSDVTFTGASGYVYNSTFENDSIVTFLDGTGIAINASKFLARSRLYAERVNSILLTYHTSSAEAYWIVRDKSNIRSYYSKFGSASRVYYYDGDAQWFYYVDISSYGFLRQYDGSVKMYYSNLDSYAEVRNENNAGELFTYGLSANSRSYLRNYNTGISRTYYTSLLSGGRLTFGTGGGTRTLQYGTIKSLGNLNFNEGATLVYSTEIGSQGAFTVNGGTHYRNNIGSYSRLTTAFNTRSVNTNGSFAQTLTAANSNTYRGFGQNNLI